MIRQVERTDAKQFLQMMKQLDNETPYMLYEKEERKTSEVQQEKMIAHFIESDTSTCLVAIIEEKIVGYVMAMGNTFQRNRHCCYLVIGILDAYQGRGIGKRLFQAIFAWAKENAITRIELTVRVDNERAITLYEKMGFIMEGKKRQSLFVNGAYKDEYYMSYIL